MHISHIENNEVFDTKKAFNLYTFNRAEILLYPNSGYEF